MNSYNEIFDHILSNNLNELERVIKGLDLNSIKNKYGDTLLIDAVYNSKKAAVKLLLDYGANPNKEDNMGNVPLMVSVGNIPEDTDISTLLLERGADPNYVNLEHGYPLMTASQRGNLETVKLLLNSGAEVNQQSLSTRNTALTTAIHWNHVDIVKLLLDKGADISLSDKLGNTAYDIVLNSIEFNKMIGEPYIILLEIKKSLEDKIKIIKSKQNLSFAKTQDKIHSMLGRDMDPGIFRNVSEHVSNRGYVPSVHRRMVNGEMENEMIADYLDTLNQYGSGKRSKRKKKKSSKRKKKKSSKREKKKSSKRKRKKSSKRKKKR